MKKTKKILFFFGTRPEAIKMAPLIKRLKKDRAFRVIVVVSAQHRKMLDQVLKRFGVKSNVDLNLMKPKQSLFDITINVLKSFESVLKKINPDFVLVHGDTTTTFSGALASFYKSIPVGHVEAGLRTNDLSRPFPEEANRKLTDSLSTLYFCPTADSRSNLVKENVPENKIFVTGNTVIDALLETAKRHSGFVNKTLRNSVQQIKDKPIILLTAHRRENFGAPFLNVLNAVKVLARRFPNVHWVYPVHPNPNVSGPVSKMLRGIPNVHLFEPLDYTDLVAVMKRSVLVVTDSGGIQEEAPALGKPVLVLRDVTERPEAVRSGTVQLVGPNEKNIVKAVSNLLTKSNVYNKMASAVNPYGDGLASQRIHKAIRWYFKLDKNRPAPFRP